MDLSTILGSVFLSALVAGLVSLRTNERILSLQYITGERTKWRSVIREKALCAFDATMNQDMVALRRCHFELSHLLHLGDPQDDYILRDLEALEENLDDIEVLNNFRIRISLLLKYEWNRAKLEASPILSIKTMCNILSKVLPKCFERYAIHRVSLEEFNRLADR